MINTDHIAKFAGGLLVLFLVSLHQAGKLFDSTVLSVIGISLTMTILGLVAFYLHETRPLAGRVETLEEDRLQIFQEVDEIAFEVERMALYCESDSSYSQSSYSNSSIESRSGTRALPRRNLLELKTEDGSLGEISKNK